MIREITGAERANIVGLCLGGTLTAALRAYLAAGGEDRIASTTLLNTLVDFSRPGRLGAFTDRASVERLEKRMAERGFLEASEMMGIFTFMRSNDLVWNYALNNWLMGEDPQPSTSSPGTPTAPACRPTCTPSTCARATWATSSQAARWSSPGRGSTWGPPRRPLRPRRHEDHIAPWEGSYLTTQVLPTPTSATC